METIKSKFVKAKKEHTCEYCNRKIKIGDTYHYSYTVDSDYSWSLKECIYCHYIVDKIIDFRELIDGLLPYEISDAIFEKGVELGFANINDKQTFELLQKLSHNIAFHYGISKEKYDIKEE